VASLPFNPALADVRQNPYPHYRELREREPVHWNDALGMWMVSRYQDVSTLLRDHRLSVNRLAAQTGCTPNAETPPRSLLNSDASDHTRLRSLVSRSFTPRTADDLRPNIEALVDELLDDLASHGTMDVISQYAYPMALNIIAEILGVPPADRDICRRLAQAIAPTLDVVRTPKQAADAMVAGEALRGYFHEIVTARRKTPKNDLISVLVEAQKLHGNLSNEEIAVMCNMILIAGHETTVSLVGNGLLALFSHPQQLRHWQSDMSLTRSAVEELLRFDPPVQMTGRVVLEDIDIGGRTMHRGHPVLLMLGAANRDPNHFHSPETLDLKRDPNPHLSFGAGSHFCLGAHLARLQGRIALERLLRRFPKLQLDQETIDWRERIALRGITSLWVTVQ
jgi:cytochrome P450